jgi:Protein of unknown function (DUF3185)
MGLFDHHLAFDASPRRTFMNPIRIAGLVLLVAGVVGLILGMQATDSFADRMSNTFTGHWTDKTNFWIVGGAAGVVLGLLLAAFGSGKTLKA